MSKTIIDRPPRIQPDLPYKTVNIPQPPNHDHQNGQELLQMLLPLLTVVGFVITAVLAGTGANLLMIIPMLLATAGSVILAFYNHRGEKQRREAEEAHYRQTLADLRHEMERDHHTQRLYYNHTFPDTATTIQIVQDTERPFPQQETTLRSGTRLWERRPEDDDFATLRLGIGTRPSTVHYELSQTDGAIPTPLHQLAQRLADDSLYLHNAPITIPLRRLPEKEDEEDEANKDKETAPPPNPTIHSLGIAGEKTAVYAHANALIAQYTTFHSPHDAKLFILASTAAAWQWAEPLPHAQPDDQTSHIFFLDSDTSEPDPYNDEAIGLNKYLEDLRKLLAQRKLRLNDRDRDAHDHPERPFILLIIDLLHKSEALAQLEADATITFLQQEGPELGTAVIFLLPHRSQIPSDCRAVIEVEANSTTITFRYAQTGLNLPRHLGQADVIPYLDQLSHYSTTLQNLDVRKSYGGVLTKVAPFLNMVNARNLPELQQTTLQKWQRSTQPQHGNPLRVKVGYMAGNKPRSLVFSAKRDGVHGMIAGSTGSGKSELLVSMIVGLAINYDPTMLNFVLVDYKGGGAFQEFANLPHCVDVITNLQASGVTRMFTAITAEMQRRQKLNVTTDTKDILEYHRKGYHLTHEPYPYLFIIIDEFAEMITANKEFKTELEMITRLGRAQGISLLLAAQRPTGITDQMRANIKFRICLRVETDGESREMLRHSAAAFLPGNIPGRGYLQVGNDDIDLIQVAYTGDKYIDPTLPGIPNVIWLDNNDTQLAELREEKDPPKLYQAIVSMVGDTATATGCVPQRAPWPAPLPQPGALTLTTPLASTDYLASTSAITHDQEGVSPVILNPFIAPWLNENAAWAGIHWGHHAMRPVIGLVDNPYAAQQLPLTLNLRRGHAAIFGASGWGKTISLRTLITSLAVTHSPGEFHSYILDLGGRNLHPLAALPHVGTVINPDEEGYVEQVAYLLREMDNLVEQRKTLLAQAELEDIYQYNQQNPLQPEAAVLIVIDNFIEFLETFGESKDDVPSTLDNLIALMRQSRPYGIHFILTAHSANIVPGKLFTLLTERLTLKLTDPTEYRTILGGSAPDMDDLAGRGYVRPDEHSLAFQMALLTADTTNGRSDISLIRTLAHNMHHTPFAGTPPLPMGSLPKTCLFTQLLANLWQLDRNQDFLSQLNTKTNQQWQKSLDPQHADWLGVTLGITSGAKPRRLHFSASSDGSHGMIAGGTGSGKSELLMTLIVAMILEYDPNILNFVLVDYKGGGAFKPFETAPHCVDSVSNLNPTAVKRMFTAINAEMERRQKLNADTGVAHIVEYRQKGLHLSHQPYPHLFIIIDEYAEMIVANPEFKEELDRITRVGRSIGVSLILASQKPMGVSDQMRANIKFRLCLRVEGADTSREMLRRSDAAALPSGLPGRGYLQVGNENLELIQVAYTGESLPTPNSQEPQKLYNLIVQLTDDLSPEAQRPRCPWPAALPSTLALTSPFDTRYLPPSITVPANPQINPAVRSWEDGISAWSPRNWQTDALRPAIGLVDNPHTATQMPLTLNLADGHAVLFGGSGTGKTTFVRTLITSLATTHAPSDLHIYALDLGGRQLNHLSDLPHLASVISPDEPGYEERVQQLLRYLDSTIETRKRLLGEAETADLYQYNHTQSQTLPAIVVIIDNFAELAESLGEEGNLAEQVLADLITLVRQARPFGIHFVLTAHQINAIPNKLLTLFSERITFRLTDPTTYHEIVGGRISDIDDMKGRGYIKTAHLPLACQIANAPAEIKELITHMQTAYGNQPRPKPIDALPRSSLYKQLVTQTMSLDRSQPFLAELRRQTQVNWHNSVAPDQAAWLSTTLGVAAGNNPHTLTFAAHADGVHGIVAGGTGSGKSELLTTLIADMALRFDPSILNFVLVDYKGGGAFKPFEDLPHCVDSISNLDPSAVTRMFTAINAEMKRRQGLNAALNVKDIVDYRRKGYHLSREPYPHLFIIIDEYAEMIADNRDFLVELERITRVGRSIGVSLILASQRPTGVTDQMRSNIKFRICLRVEGVDESRELLRKPDAAFLPSGMPGRGYLQVGNEDLNLVQIAYTGESVQEAQLEEDPEPPKLFEVIVRLAAALATDKQTPPRRPRPWPDFLPSALALTKEIVTDYLPDIQDVSHIALNAFVAGWENGRFSAWSPVNWQDGLQATIGLIDDPQQASQHLLTLDLARNHHALFGASGWGKTTFLQTLLVALTAAYSPDALQCYILDLGGRSFGSFKALPHLGDIILPDDEGYEERVGRLLEKLERLIAERKTLFSEGDARDLLDYNRQHPKRPLPFLLILIDNFAELRQNFEMLIDDTLIPLLRQARTYGITFFLTGSEPSAISSKVYNLIGERLTLSLTDPTKYFDIVGRGAADFASMPGRGLVRWGKRPLIFQAAHPFATENEGESLRRFAHNLAQAWAGVKPEPIYILPQMVTLDAALNGTGLPGWQPVAMTERTVPVGLNNDLQPATLNLQQNGPHLAIVGPPLSGKTTALISWLLALSRRHAPSEARVVLIDFQQKLVRYGGEQTLADLPQVITAVTEPEQLPAFTEQLTQECQYLAKAAPLFIVIEDFDDFVEEVDGNRELSYLLNELALLARRHGTDGLHFLIAGALDNPSPLKKRVLASGYGLGLRSSDALATLHAYTRNFPDLPVGRGYIVNAGQLQRLQVAQPYTTETDKIAALDQWISTIQQQYPNQQATWTHPFPAPKAANSVAGELEHAANDAAILQQVMVYLKQAIAFKYDTDGLPLATIGVNLDELSDDDILRMAEDCFPAH